MTTAQLSRMLFAAREELEMWADVVEAQTGRAANSTRALIREIDDYRASRGWQASGFGGEEP